jgi:hypothetical protein
MVATRDSGNQILIFYTRGIIEGDACGIMAELGLGGCDVKIQNKW